MGLDIGSGRVVVVGAGHSGGAFALTLRKLGFAGAITLVGEETEHPYERPALSKSMLIDGQAQPVFLAEAPRWDGIDLRLKTAVAGIDRAARTVSVSDGTSVSYDALVLATGGRARPPGFPACAAIHTLRTAADARRLRNAASASRSAVIIGGGVIGLEVAASLRSRSLRVDVIEAAPRLLGRNVPPQAASWLAALHAGQGVAMHLGQQVADVSDTAAGVRVRLADGTEFVCDLVVVGIGILPRTDLAEAAGLPCHDGVLVDECYRSVADPAVFAIGDAAAWPGPGGPVRAETWDHAQRSAGVAARTLLGLPPAATEVPWFWTDQFGHTLQVAGTPAAADEVLDRGPACCLYLRDGALVGVACLDAPRVFAAARRLIASGTRLDRASAADTGIDLRKAIAA